MKEEGGCTDCGGCPCSMEKRLAAFGAKIDELIFKAHLAKSDLNVRLHDLEHMSEEALERGNRAVADIKASLEIAQQELNEAWLAVRAGSERAVDDVLAKERPANQPHVPCTTHHKVFGSSDGPYNEADVIL